MYELGYGYSYFNGEWDETYTEAQDQAALSHESDYYQDIVIWLEENLTDRYKIDIDFDHVSSMEVQCVYTLEFFDQESELAYKLKWG